MTAIYGLAACLILSVITNIILDRENRKLKDQLREANIEVDSMIYKIEHEIEQLNRQGCQVPDADRAADKEKAKAKAGCNKANSSGDSQGETMKEKAKHPKAERKTPTTDRLSLSQIHLIESLKKGEIRKVETMESEYTVQIKRKFTQSGKPFKGFDYRAYLALWKKGLVRSEFKDNGWSYELTNLDIQIDQEGRVHV